MASNPRPIANTILLVEGQDDRHVIQHIINVHNNQNQNIPSLSIVDKEGIDNLLPVIPSEINAPGRQVVGIVVDANSHVRSRWVQVTNRIKITGIAPPINPHRHGTIIPGRPDGVSRKPRVGIWLMPNNRYRGEIEEFIQSMIPTNDYVWPLSDTYVVGIPKRYQKFKSPKTMRAKVHAWLATREDPRLMGAAIGAGDLDINSPLCTHFRAWLQRLFN